jgi:putative transposase
VKFAAIADWAASNAYPVSFMCRELGVSRSGYYAWRNAEPSQRSKDDTTLIAIMRRIYDKARGNPGVRRMRASLAALGYKLSHKRVWRLMKAAGLRGRHPKAWKRTTIGGDKPVNAPDLIGRAFHAERPNEKWCGDITYVKTWDGWACLATVIDLHSARSSGGRSPTTCAPSWSWRPWAWPSPAAARRRESSSIPTAARSTRPGNSTGTASATR